MARYVSDAGQVFFDTPNALLPSDSDGTSDVYEYENGQLSLISDGDDPQGAKYVDNTADGSNVLLRNDRAARSAGHRRRLRHLRRAGRWRVPVLSARTRVPGRGLQAVAHARSRGAHGGEHHLLRPREPDARVALHDRQGARAQADGQGNHDQAAGERAGRRPGRGQRQRREAADPASPTTAPPTR